MLPRLRLFFTCFSSFSLLLGGCGYVGLVDELTSDPDGFGGATGTGGQTNGGHGPGGDGSGGSHSEVTGGSAGESGSVSTGGLGGAEGSGGTTAIPAYPCSTTCDDPFLLYRSFEIGVPVVPHITLGGEVTRDKEKVRVGDYSMRFTQDKPGSKAELSELIDVVASGSIYLRTWVFIPEGAVTDWIRLLAFNGAGDSGIDIDVREGQFITSYVRPSRYGESSEPKAYPVSSWFCLQVGIDVNDADGTVKVEVDGETVLSHDEVDTMPGRGIDRVVYGLGASGVRQTGATVYFDDIVVSTQPVTCD